MKLPPGALVVMLMTTALAACVAPPDDAIGSPGASPAATAGETRQPPDEPEATATPGTTPGATPAPIAADPPPLRLEPVASGLESPISIAAGPNGWLLVNERAGRMVGIHVVSGEQAEVADLRDRVRGQGEQGLLGLALHPDWPRVARSFVHYSDAAGDTVLAELDGTVDADGAPRLDPASERVLLRVEQPFGNHNGGQLAFGPDGFLWMGLGDGGSGGDPLGSGQDPNTLLGAILRLDVSERGAFAIPDDNPFVDGGGAPEVYLYGLRNPWRFSFDRVTGELWIADVGQSAFEEVNRLDPATTAGANLGWNVMEASHCFADAGCSTDGLLLPVSEYGRELGCSVTGGFVYRGSGIPDLAGWYLFGDYCTGTVFGVPSDVQELTTPRRLLETGAAISAFGEDTDGELYLADIASGSVYRLVAGD